MRNTTFIWGENKNSQTSAEIARMCSFPKELFLSSIYFGLRAQIITRLNSQPCSNWRYCTQNKKYVLSKCLLRLRVFVFFVLYCWFLYGPIYHGALSFICLHCVQHSFSEHLFKLLSKHNTFMRYSIKHKTQKYSLSKCMLRHDVVRVFVSFLVLVFVRAILSWCP